MLSELCRKDVTDETGKGVDGNPKLNFFTLNSSFLAHLMLPSSKNLSILEAAMSRCQDILPAA
jgi:hypothetical protein